MCSLCIFCQVLPSYLWIRKNKNVTQKFVALGSGPPAFKFAAVSSRLVARSAEVLVVVAAPKVRPSAPLPPLSAGLPSPRSNMHEWRSKIGAVGGWSQAELVVEREDGGGKREE
ncbi:hypothetical protein B0H12DRAFT_1074111 [Mycena haematopus]|nr:hypothetical protein B0H12DRAFT_1074111 [Mycena haematopus]